MSRILLVEDDSNARVSTRRILEVSGYEVDEARDGQEAKELLIRNQERYSIVLSDIRMPRLSGIDLFEWLRSESRSIPVVLMTAFGRVEDAVRAMKAGAVDFLTKPFSLATLQTTMAAAVRIADERNKRRETDGIRADFFWGQASRMVELQRSLRQIVGTDSTVLLQGESGTGKERIARWIHDQSRRAEGPWVPINCGAIPESLVESELFGYVRGAFTGADRDKIGLLEQADRGTLFLDEIGDMPLAAQTRLLRVLQEGEVRRVGSNETRRVNLRVIAATHQNLQQKVRDGTFREDLFFRLDVIRFVVPPLRARLGDVAELARFLIAKRESSQALTVSPDAEEILMQYPWPGNVRELENALERAAVFASDGVIRPEHLPEHVQRSALPSGHRLGEHVQIEVGMPLREVERILIERTLEATQGDKQETARLLGINSRTVYRKLKEMYQRSEDELGSSVDWERPHSPDSIEATD